MRGEGQFIRGTIKYKKIVYLILFLLVAVGVYGLAVINKDEFPTFEIKEGLSGNESLKGEKITAPR